MIRNPFTHEIDILDVDDVEVTNPYTGNIATLTPMAGAVDDTIKGAELIGDYQTVQVGLDWFASHYPAEYMILLD